MSPPPNVQDMVTALYIYLIVCVLLMIVNSLKLLY